VRNGNDNELTEFELKKRINKYNKDELLEYLSGISEEQKLKLVYFMRYDNQFQQSILQKIDSFALFPGEKELLKEEDLFSGLLKTDTMIV